MATTDAVLVVGGCGGLGYHIVKQLLEPRFRVGVLDIQIEKNCLEGARYFKGDVTSKKQTLGALKEMEATIMINTASPTWLAHANRETFDRINIRGNENLLECAKESGLKVFLYTSSSSIVHDNYSDLVNVNEELPYVLLPEQKEYYSHTKAIAEKMSLEANQQGGVLTAAIRAATMIGENDGFTVSNLITNAKNGRLRFQAGDGTNMFDLTYTGNTAYAHILAVQKLLREHADPALASSEKRVNGEAFFITNDEPWPFWDTPRALGAAAGYPTRKEDMWQIPVPAYFAMAFVMESFYFVTTFGRKLSPVDRKMVRYLTMTRTFDISKAKERLGYSPRVNMHEAIKRAAGWFNSQNQTVRLRLSRWCCYGLFWGEIDMAV